MTQCQLVYLHLFCLAEHLNPGFHTVAHWSTLAGMALCPDQGLWTWPHFLGVPADGWSLHRFTSMYLYLYTGPHLCLRLWPPAGPLMAGTNPMGLDGPMDSTLRCWLSPGMERVAILLAWLMAQHAPLASFTRGHLPPWHSQENHHHPV